MCRELLLWQGKWFVIFNIHKLLLLPYNTRQQLHVIFEKKLLFSQFMLYISELNSSDAIWANCIQNRWHDWRKRTFHKLMVCGWTKNATTKVIPSLHRHDVVVKTSKTGIPFLRIYCRRNSIWKFEHKSGIVKPAIDDMVLVHKSTIKS